MPDPHKIELVCINSYYRPLFPHENEIFRHCAGANGLRLERLLELAPVFHLHGLFFDINNHERNDQKR